MVLGDEVVLELVVSMEVVSSDEGKDVRVEHVWDLGE